MKPFLSLCMIVKNEEKVIERCLSSIAHLVDEIIVVDTGSTDRTKEIVAEYTSNIYDFEWIGDFSAARNFASSKATGEWILVLDADEYVDEENFKEFIREIKENNNDDSDTYTAKILNFTGNFGENLIQNFHDRIYKNNGDISYYRKIHEQFKNNKNEPLKSKNSSLIIFHSGYLNQVVNEKSKNQRNKELLDKEMSNGETNAFDYFNIGNEYCSIGEYSKALEAYLEAYKLKTDFRLSWVSTTLVQIIICLMNLKRFNDALNVIKDAEDLYTNSPEFLYLKGEMFFLRGQMEDAKSTFLEIINNNENYNHIILRPDLKDQKPNMRLGDIFLFQENFNEAIYYYTTVLNINKYNEQSINKVVYLLNKFHSDAEISSFLNSNKLVNHQNITSYVKACFEVGNPTLALDLLKNSHEENKLLYKVALLKKLCINNEGNIEELDEILKFDVLKDLVESNWVNVIDLLLLREYVSQENNLFSILKPFEQNEYLRTLIELVDGKEKIENINADLITFSLKILITYKNFALCDVLLDDIEKTDKKTLAKVASLLFSYGFKVEALQLYDESDWGYFKEQDFVNIINSLLETNNIDSAIELAKYAVIAFKDDFRFYTYILDHTEDTELFRLTFIEAQSLFAGSMYLEKYALKL
jgi:glycosyltransferase involved in cell wall biosynthesis